MSIGTQERKVSNRDWCLLPGMAGFGSITAGSSWDIPAMHHNQAEQQLLS